MQSTTAATNPIIEYCGKRTISRPHKAKRICPVHTVRILALEFATFARPVPLAMKGKTSDNKRPPERQTVWISSVNNWIIVVMVSPVPMAHLEPDRLILVHFLLHDRS